jgi:hypothetical protein
MDIEALPKHIVEALREYKGLLPDDDSQDAELAQLSDAELFEFYCESQKLIGWATHLMNVLDALREAGARSSTAVAASERVAA